MPINETLRTTKVASPSLMSKHGLISRWSDPDDETVQTGYRINTNCTLEYYMGGICFNCSCLISAEAICNLNNCI